MEQTKTAYQQITLFIAANSNRRLAAYARFFAVLENSSSTNIKVRIGDQPITEISEGIAVELPDAAPAFRHLDFFNPTGTDITIIVALSNGRIYDARLVLSGTIDVNNSTDIIESENAVTALKVYNIDNAAAVDKGGGLVGVPVTGQPFSTGETVVISGTTNYNGSFTVDASSSANEVVITATYNAETFTAAEEIYAIRSIAGDSDQREIILQNTGIYTVWFGDANINAASKKGCRFSAGDSVTLSTSAAIYFQAESGNSSISINRLKQS